MITYVSHLSDLQWPGHCVCVYDSALPEELVEELPDPKLGVTAGESLKSLKRMAEIAEAILELRSTRPLTIVAVGGGSVGDSLGFAASVLWRGVRLWHVPTTLLAMVDSAHGGKTALNLGRRKNQLGTFYEAQRVVICDAFLDSLPLDQREEGLAELVKTLWLGDPESLAHFDDGKLRHQILAGEVAPHRDVWRDLIAAAVDVKMGIVAEDPQEESGARRVLNLGHTAGHALEAIYGLPHGRAVAWGLAAVALLSTERTGLSPDEGRRLLAHVDPLLVPLPRYPSETDRRDFERCLGADKKRVDGELISILLSACGQPIQTRDISADDWWLATRRAFQNWSGQALRIGWPDTPRNRRLELPPGKSEANRAQMIAYLRKTKTKVAMPASIPPDDVVDLRRALEVLESCDPTDALTLHAGDGGTTARFLMAVAATRPAPTTLHLGESCLKRPHGPLLEALRRGGASVQSTDRGYVLRGWTDFPRSLSVDVSTSSQFASALALLSASGHEFTLHLEGDPISTGYFELTLSVLQSAGVEVARPSSDVLEFSKPPGLGGPLTLEVPRDSSSAVVWQALALLDDRFAGVSTPNRTHPDSRFAEIAEELLDAGSQSVAVSLRDTPDLAPPLAALTCLIPAGIEIFDAPHLRLKESDRIGDLVDAFDEVGLRVDATDDGFVIAPGIQSPRPDSVFDPRDDHRLAMAALILSLPVAESRQDRKAARDAPTLAITDARCVTKSYPDLWRHARRLGFFVEPLKLGDSEHS